MNEPRYEVFPETAEGTDHETEVRDFPAFHPSGDEYTKAAGYCEACDWEPEDSDPVEARNEAWSHELAHKKLTGEFVWHFKDANGKITHIGGEPFVSRGDAHRSIRGVVADDCSLALKFHVPVHSISIDHAIVDLDENGKVIERAEPDPDR